MRIKTGFLLLASVIIASLQINAQVILTNPAFPSATDLVEIIFDASQGNGGLAGYSGDVYAHTGVITNKSTSPSDWKFVKTNWGVNTPETKLERIGDDLYKLLITPSVRTYYGVPETDTIVRMAFVFRSAVQVGNQWLEGKTETGGDIFADIYPSGLFLKFNSPSQSALLVEPGNEVIVESVSNIADSMFLYRDKIRIKAVAGAYIRDTIEVGETGKTFVQAIAWTPSESVADSFYYFVRQPVAVEELPEGIIEGINYLSDTSVILSLYAPFKEHVFVIGDFNNWEYSYQGYMKRDPDGNRYWIHIDNLEAGKEYIFQYLVDGSIRIGDPYAEKVSDPWNDNYIQETTYPGILPYPSGKASGIATVLQTAQPEYTWEFTSFNPPNKHNLVIYELLVRDFVAKHDYQTLIDTLGYLKSMGINAIELMPVNEFEGNSSWGYNPNYYFAPDKYYGPKNDLKRFIDACHQNGIAVIVDVVLNHSFGTSPMVMLYWDAASNKPAANNPWFNQEPKHDFNVGFDFNHESPDTKRLVNRVVKFWLEEYNIDGYRFDLSKGFTQKNTLGNTNAWGLYDAPRIELWKNIADTIWSVNPDAYVILEHFAENAEEKVLANYGMMLWGKASDEFAKAAMGTLSGSSFTWASYKTRGWNEPNLISYMESHDEERMMVRLLKEGNITNPFHRVKDSTIAMKRLQLANVFFYSIPGPKMLWQFGELAYDYSIEYNGRTGEKPIRWNYKHDYRRKTLRNVISTMIKLRQEYPVFSTSDFSMSLSEYIKYIHLYHNDMNVSLIGNFDVYQGDIVPGFPKTGTWYEYFTGDSLIVSSVSDAITLSPGEYRLYTDVRLSTPETGLGMDELQGKESFSLMNPFPNPLGRNETLSIPVCLRSQSFINIVVSDITGRQLGVLAEGMYSPGRHTFKWTPSGSLPGMYFIRITGSERSETIPVLVK